MDATPPHLTITKEASFWRGGFQAMASPCELLMEAANQQEAEQLLTTAYQEAKRIEHKFSRYRDDNIIHQLNHAQGQATVVDDETALLLDYAHTCFELSEGRFDITSGVLRRLWKFDGQSSPPTQSAIDSLLPLIGWHRVSWEKPTITLPINMEIDLGGIGKEYAVDRTALLLQEKSSSSFLLNYGGDIYVSGPRSSGDDWQVAIEGDQNNRSIAIKKGGIATSGDTHRFITHNDKRYGHIINPKSGWPVTDTPSTITVVASTCIEAGMLATFAMLEEEEAIPFLEEQQVEFYYTKLSNQ